MKLEQHVDLRKAALVVGPIAFVAATFALLADTSEALVSASTPIGVAFSGLAGVVGGAMGARTFTGGALAGAAAGFTNALVGILTAMFLRDVGWGVLFGGCFGGALLGAVTGVLGHLLLLVVKRRGTPMMR